VRDELTDAPITGRFLPNPKKLIEGGKGCLGRVKVQRGKEKEERGAGRLIKKKWTLGRICNAFLLKRDSVNGMQRETGCCYQTQGKPVGGRRFRSGGCSLYRECAITKEGHDFGKKKTTGR